MPHTYLRSLNGKNMKHCKNIVGSIIAIASGSGLPKHEIYVPVAIAALSPAVPACAYIAVAYMLKVMYVHAIKGLILIVQSRLSLGAQRLEVLYQL